MEAFSRQRLRLTETVLAGLVILITVTEFTAVPRLYPIDDVYTILTLIIPGLLGITALLGAIDDGHSIGAVVVRLFDRTEGRFTSLEQVVDRER